MAELRKDLIRDLKRGDILVMENNTLFATWIKKATKSIYTHAEIYIGGGHCVGATNKGGKGVRVRTIQHNMNRFFRIDTLRWLNMSEDKAEQVSAAALSHVGERYNYLMLFLFPFTFLLPDKWKNPMVKKEAKVCSELVTKSFKEAGVDIIPGKTEGQESPGDIGKAMTLRFIGAYVEGMKTKLKRGK